MKTGLAAEVQGLGQFPDFEDLLGGGEQAVDVLEAGGAGGLQLDLWDISFFLFGLQLGNCVFWYFGIDGVDGQRSGLFDVGQSGEDGFQDGSDGGDAGRGDYGRHFGLDQGG